MQWRAVFVAPGCYTRHTYFARLIPLVIRFSRVLRFVYLPQKQSEYKMQRVAASVTGGAVVPDGKLKALCCLKWDTWNLTCFSRRG